MPRRWRLPSVVVAPHGPVDEDAEPVAPPPRDWGERVGRLELGYRALFVTNSGYNPYATNDYLGAVSLAASRTVIAEGAFALALGVAWDYGWTSATARTDAASLHFQTLSIPIEARAHAGRWGFAFVRVAPGLANERAELDDATAPSSLTRSAWLFAVDAGAGYAFPVLPIPPARGRLPRVWLVAEGGYTWTPDVRMTLAPRDASHAADVDLGTLGMRGATLRFALAVSY